MTMNLKVSLNDFKEYLEILDERLSCYRQERKGTEQIKFPVEIYAIGGFALMYYGLRYSGTEDIDSVKLLEKPVKEIIHEIAAEQELPIDWLNDIPGSKLFYDKDSFRWIDTGWQYKNIRIYVVKMEDLLYNKLCIADKMLMQYTERSHYRDFDDIESIIDALGCNYNTIEELVGWFRSQGIRLHDFPNVYNQFFELIKEDDLYWPDGHI